MGMLRRGSLVERALRRLERRAARASDAIITLSEAAVPALGARAGCDLSPKAHVISTCVDLNRFQASALPKADPVRLLLSGTLNGLYDVPTMVRLARRVGDLRETVLEWVGPGNSTWEEHLSSIGVRREELSFAEMPARLSCSHVGLSLQFGESRVSPVAAAPIKLAEFLASGRPVVVSAGLGDFPRLVTRYRCGVVVADTSDDAVGQAAADLCQLLEDEEMPARCRLMAEEHFDLEHAVDELIGVYTYVTGVRSAA
jgi:glycosyltransferase involved in cell wall biosynthesis